MDQCGDGIKLGDYGSGYCDDGNLLDNDGCSSNCRVELGGWKCNSTSPFQADVCTLTCGDGRRPLNSGIEECDDGNAVDGDGCSS